MSNYRKLQATKLRLGMLLGNVRYHAEATEAATERMGTMGNDWAEQQMMRHVKGQVTLMREYLDAVEAECNATMAECNTPVGP